MKSTNLQTHEPVDFKETTKIEPHENKVLHSIVWNTNVMSDCNLETAKSCFICQIRI